MKHLAYSLLLTGLLASTAQATEFNRVLADKSHITFAYSQMGVTMDGRFAKFAGQLRFDPAQPGAASVAIDVDLGSIDTGTPDLDAETAGTDWFNIGAFPKARFVSTAIKPAGGNRYSVAGKLTIKGRTRDVVVPATFTAQGATGVFAGSFTLRRGDFAVGEGAWSAFDVVANDVQVHFNIVAAGT